MTHNNQFLFLPFAPPDSGKGTIALSRCCYIAFFCLMNLPLIGRHFITHLFASHQALPTVAHSDADRSLALQEAESGRHDVTKKASLIRKASPDFGCHGCEQLYPSSISHFYTCLSENNLRDGLASATAGEYDFFRSSQFFFFTCDTLA